MKAQIDDTNTLLERKNENLKNLQQDLENENTSWTSKTSSHEELIKKYNDEIDIINQAIDTMEKGGITRS